MRQTTFWRTEVVGCSAFRLLIYFIRTTPLILHHMATARFLLEVRLLPAPDEPRVIELLRPGRPPWQLMLPAEVDPGTVTPLLVDYVTAQYLVEQPTEGVRLGWETVYALVRTALEEASSHRPPQEPFAA